MAYPTESPESLFERVGAGLDRSEAMVLVGFYMMKRTLPPVERK